jgi:hypothetical protein
MSIPKTILIAAIVLACAPDQMVSAQRPPSSKWVDFGAGELVKTADGYALVYGISTSTRESLYALVEVSNPDGTRRCEFLKKLEPKASYRFECPLADAAAGQSYASRLTAYFDDRLEDRELRYEPVFQVTTQVLGAADKAAAPAAAVRTVANGVDEGAASPALPTTFKPTWYRRLERGFSMKAYEDSGDLTVNADALVFTTGKKTVRIPFSDITSVRWEPMPRDIANYWVVVRFTNDQQQPDGVGFRDGSRMGASKGTGMMYLAVHRAAHK